MSLVATRGFACDVSSPRVFACDVAEPLVVRGKAKDRCTLCACNWLSFKLIHGADENGSGSPHESHQGTVVGYCDRAVHLGNGERNGEPHHWPVGGWCRSQPSPQSHGCNYSR